MFQTNIQAFKDLGRLLADSQWVNLTFGEAIERQYRENSWCTPEFCRYALAAIAQMLAPDALESYYERYRDIVPDKDSRRTVSVISTDNIPLATFHDFFCILVSGNDYQGKLSSQDKHLLPILAQELVRIEPSFAKRIFFVDRLSDFDALISTDSNNSARYFNHYFSKYPHILRKKRSSVAVINETESDDELRGLSNDIYIYFGLGYRSVSKLFVPRNYNFMPFLQILTRESQPIAQHHQFNNNLEYQKAIHLMNQIPYMDAGTFLIVENQNYVSPVGMIYYEYYDNVETINRRLEADTDQLQCIVSRDPHISHAASFGSTCFPTLTDYPDGIDTLRWLSELG